jgi:phosphoenolpyruvate carboxylase
MAKDSYHNVDDRLWADVVFLGELLGEIIRQLEGQHALDQEERIRKIAIDRRVGAPDAATQLANEIRKTTLDEKRILIKAFSNFFQLTNIAEDQQRVRRLREYEQARDGLVRESIAEAIHGFYQQGLDADAVRAVLNRLRIRLVLTAHPSEAKRREILVKLRRIAALMARRDRETLLPREAAALQDELLEAIEEMWLTRPIRAVQTTVFDEVEFGLYFLTTVVMDSVLDIYEELRHYLRKYYPDDAKNWDDLPIILRYSSWIGGDRDGNPNVTTDITLGTLTRQYDAARRVYLDEVAQLRDHLTHGEGETNVSATLQAALNAYQTQHPTNPQYIGEPYRQMLDVIWHKLNDSVYRRADDLLGDLSLIVESLRTQHSQHIASGRLERFMRKVQLFGLHLMPLEIREDAGLHAEALHELFQTYNIADNYLALPEDQKQALLTAEIPNKRPLFPADTSSFSAATQRIIETWQMIGTAHRTYTPIVIDTVIASMSKQPSDVLAMLLLASEVGIQDHVNLVPLFETIQDLYNAPDVMRQLLSNPVYLDHINRSDTGRGRRQQIMIGYSDSSKDGGYIASNWHLYTAQQRLVEACEEHKVLLELFHGRGGSIGRGGGPTNRSLRSQPPESLGGGIKITEQGEVIAYRYNNPEIARRHLNQVLHAGLLVLGNQDQQRQTPPEWHEALEYLSAKGREVYRDFVYNDENFLEYWQAATPINELSQLRISSRPAKRKSNAGFTAMRAIPWVFSWMQSRVIIPSWYGVGSAFEGYCQQNANGLQLLQQMYTDWDFFRALVDNTQLDVAKADMGIAALYAGLVDDAAIRASFFRRIQDEHERAQRKICEVTGQSELLEHMPAIKHSIERRNPYVDPLNFIQVELLRDLRAMDPDAAHYQQTLNAVLTTINGIAAGMKTTG